MSLVRNRSPNVKYPYSDFLYIRGLQSIYHTSYRNMYPKVHNINRYNLYIYKNCYLYMYIRIIIYYMYIPGTTSNINYRKINFLIHIYSGSLQFVLLYVGSPKVKEVLLSNILRQGQNIFGKDWTVLFFILLIFLLYSLIYYLGK